MDSLEGIEAGARDVLRGYPLAAGLTSVADGEYLPEPQEDQEQRYSDGGSLLGHLVVSSEGGEHKTRRPRREGVVMILPQRSLRRPNRSHPALSSLFLLHNSDT